VTKKTILTRADYQERRASLDALLIEARSHYSQAAYQLEMGDGDQAGLDKALANLAELQGRAANLDAAWEVAQREHAAETDAADTKSREDALAQIGKSIAERAKAITAISEAIETLGPLVAAIRDAESRILSAARPHLNVTQNGDLKSTILGFGSVHDRVAACGLLKAGFDVRFMVDSFETREYLDEGIESRLAFTEKVIRGAVKTIAPQGVA
jgi:tetratricopeptide (TPR) repeat protein